MRGIGYANNDASKFLIYPASEDSLIGSRDCPVIRFLNNQISSSVDPKSLVVALEVCDLSGNAGELLFCVVYNLSNHNFWQNEMRTSPADILLKHFKGVAIH